MDRVSVYEQPTISCLVATFRRTALGEVRQLWDRRRTTLYNGVDYLSEVSPYQTMERSKQVRSNTFCEEVT